MSKIIQYLPAFFMMFMAQIAGAAENPWTSADQVQAQLLSGVESIGKAENFDALLHLRLGEGWHTYWRVPGDAGLAPVFKWTDTEDESANIKSVAVAWPLPVRHNEMDFMTFGYEGDIEFPLTVMVREPGRPAKLAGSVELMACKDICIPQTVNFTLDIPAGNGATSEQQRLIDLAKRKVPGEGNTALSIDTTVIGPDGLVVGAFARDGFDNADIFVTAGDFGFTAKPEIMVDAKDKQRALIKIKKPAGIDDLNKFLNGKTVSITFTTGHDAMEKSIGF